MSIQIARTCENPIVHCAVPNFIAYNPIRKIPMNLQPIPDPETDIQNLDDNLS